ncbi:DUF4180 domain-containing protein [Kribbella deserti]|uniref:DUF4180 domain-containing protein n=1 Tax=Kribbella deserti TaxID=1926257 RepID=A0ABV6QKH3_9ACTN
MKSQIVRYGEQVVAVVSTEGPALRTQQDVVDLIGEHYFENPDCFAVPVTRLADDFFDLSSRIAGEVVQRFVMYGSRLAVIGDISHHTAARPNLDAFVRECNQGREVWFLPDLPTLGTRLTAA